MIKRMRGLFAAAIAISLLSACGSLPWDAKTSEAPQPPAISGTTISDVALSIAQHVSFGNEQLFVVTDGRILDKPVWIFEVDAASGTRVSAGAIHDTPILWYTVVVTKPSSLLTDKDLQLIVYSTADLLRLSAQYFLSDDPANSSFTHIVITVVEPGAEVRYVLAGYSELLAEKQKDIAASWLAFVGKHFYESRTYVIVRVNVQP